MGRADFFVRRKKRKKKKGRRPETYPDPDRLSSFSAFFQIILWHDALVALCLRIKKQRVRMS
jgi:hypothetical protein